MTAETFQRICRDCQGPMNQIRIVDKSDCGHQDLEYVRIDAKKDWMRHVYPVAGKVASFMCQSCGGIQLFGRRNS